LFAKRQDEIQFEQHVQEVVLLLVDVLLTFKNIVFFDKFPEGHLV